MSKRSGGKPFCPECGKAATGNFCQHCGAKLGGRFCNQCGAKIAPNAKFCNQCGDKAGRGPFSDFQVIVPDSESSGSGAFWAFGAFGILLIFAGIVVAGYFAFGYDTTVGATNAFTGEYMGRVNNIGLTNDRSIGVMIGLAVFFVGAIAALSSKSKK